MAAIKLTVHDTGSNVCSLTGREADGLSVSFDDGTLKESFLSWKAFRQILGLKAGQPKPEPKTATALPVGSAPAAVKYR